MPPPPDLLSKGNGALAQSAFGLQTGMALKILVTGVTGQVGWELVRSLTPVGQVIAVDRRQGDFTQPASLTQLLRNVQPDVIVNTAAYTAVDRAEQEEDIATIVNGAAVEILAQEAKKLGALLVHYSTDYVFDGAKASPYVESDRPRPLNAYGRSKLQGEQAIAAVGGDFLILRTSWVYAARGQNFLHTVLRLASERETLQVVDDQHGAPTWARNIADATAHLVCHAQAERSRQAFASGILNVSAEGATSWHGFAQAVVDGVRTIQPGLRLRVSEIVPIPTERYPTPATRPKNSLLDGATLKDRCGVVMPSWDVALRLCLPDVGLPSLSKR
jgi:dTDP-4-dehydrorhamnose reductase